MVSRQAAQAKGAQSFPFAPNKRAGLSKFYTSRCFRLPKTGQYFNVLTMIILASDAKDFFRIIGHFDDHVLKRLGRKLKGPVTNHLMALRDLRSMAFADPKFVGEYLKLNPARLNEEELSSVQEWQQHQLVGRFLIHKERKDGCIFTATWEGAPEMVYLVKGLTQPISEITPFLPCLVETRLLPFRGHIVTEGILAPLGMHFGPGARAGFGMQLRELTAKHGIQTTLPADAQTVSTPDKMLAAYLSTASSRKEFARQITALRKQGPALEAQYLHHMGRENSKALKATLKAKGIVGHFAVLEDVIIAGASDKSSAEKCAANLIKPELLPSLVWIKL